MAGIDPLQPNPRSRGGCCEKSIEFKAWISAEGRFCCKSPAEAAPNRDRLWRKLPEVSGDDGAAQQDQVQLFYSFNLDEAVPEDHLVRKIAAVLDLSWVHSELAGFCSPMGRHP